MEIVKQSYLSAHDKLGEQERRIDRTESRVQEIDTHGSSEVRGMRQEVHKIQVLLARITTHMGIEEE